MNASDASKPLKIGLCLGSGGVRGCAHFGVIRTLLKHGVEIFCVSGSSSGSVVAAALAADRLDAVEDFFRRMNWWRAFKLFNEIAWPFRGGWLTGKRVKEALRERLGTLRFEDCRIPFTAVAMDMMNGLEYPIRTGDLVDGTFASMAVQGFFKPVARDGHWIADGGLNNPFPVKACRDMGADFVIGVDVNLGQKLDTPYRPDRMPSLWTIFNQTCRIIQNNWTRRILSTNDRPDLLLQPDLHDIRMWHLRDVTRAILRGKRAAEEMLHNLPDDLRARLAPRFGSDEKRA